VKTCCNFNLGSRSYFKTNLLRLWCVPHAIICRCSECVEWTPVPSGTMTVYSTASTFICICIYSTHCHVHTYTARYREDAIRDDHWNAKRHSRWSSQVSFQTAHLKRDLNFDHRGIRFAFRQAFGLSFSRERAVLSTYKYHPHPIYIQSTSYIYIHIGHARRRRSELKYLDLQIIQFSWILF